MKKSTEKKKSAYREPLILIVFVILGAFLGLASGEKSIDFVLHWSDLVESAVCFAGASYFLSPAPPQTSQTPNEWVNCWYKKNTEHQEPASETVDTKF